jgi:GNAT superfamily N-acetyltransferase
MRVSVSRFAARVSLRRLRPARLQPCFSTDAPATATLGHARPRTATATLATDAPATAVAIQRLELSHANQAAAVLERAFDNEYSWSRPLGMPTERFRHWMSELYLPERAACAAPASLVATREGGTSSEALVAGVCTLEDFYAPEPEAEGNPPPGMRAIDGILGECKNIFHSEAVRRGLAVEKGHLGKVAYVAFLAVDGEVRRQRVGRRLVEQAVEQLTGQDGFSVVVAFCTSYKSRALFQGIGFQRWGGASYQEYTIDGAIPFTSLPKDECAVLVWTANKAI